MATRILKGTTLKMQVFWDYPSDPSITLDTIDFYLEYWTSSKNKFTAIKEDLVREEAETEEGMEVNWYLYMNTEELGNGSLVMRIHADVPDEDAPVGVKVEYVEYKTDVQIYG